MVPSERLCKQLMKKRTRHVIILLKTLKFIYSVKSSLITPHSKQSYSNLLQVQRSGTLIFSTVGILVEISLRILFPSVCFHPLHSY